MRQFWKENFGDDEIVAFIDYSGDETFNDPGNPVFVLGCCLVRGRQLAAIRANWSKLRGALFGNDHKALHMRKARMSSRRITALKEFFENAECYRVSIAHSNRTQIEGNPFPPDLIFQSSVGLIGNAIAKLMTGNPSSGLSFVIEDSDRLRIAYQRHLPKYQFTMDGSALQVSWTFVKKEEDEPGLEIADFIFRSTAGFIRNGRKEGCKFGPRYRAIFGVK